jgi:IS5 family transposase
MKYPKRSQYKYAKSRYRIGNWPEYEAGLRRRGDLTVWLSEDAIDSWREPPSGKPGGQRTYANIAIEAALTIRMVFHLPLRQTEGFLRSLAQLLDLDLPIPDHTTLSRRHQKLGEIPFRAAGNNPPIHLLIDSTGLRIHVGHMQKPPRNRAWRKLHLAVDAASGEIVASDLTTRRTHDCTQVPALLEQIADPVASVLADGAYDSKAVYEAAYGRGGGRAVRVLIPPGRNAQLNPEPSAALQERNRNIRSIRELGRREWHTSSGYSKRSMAENTVFRYKTMIGRSMRTRTFDGQRVEVQIACKVLNAMTRLGMPNSYRVA